MPSCLMPSPNGGSCCWTTLLQERFVKRFRPEHIRAAVYSYIKAGGKSLRPAVALLACGALGGDETRAMPVAAAIEVFHTWTLVHDDVIDRDDRRRSLPTVHEDFARRAKATNMAGVPPTPRIMARLSPCWLAMCSKPGPGRCYSMRTSNRDVRAELVVQLAQDLASRITPLLVEGETLDVQFAGSTRATGRGTGSGHAVEKNRRALRIRRAGWRCYRAG